MENTETYRLKDKGINQRLQDVEEMMCLFSSKLDKLLDRPPKKEVKKEVKLTPAQQLLKDIYDKNGVIPREDLTKLANDYGIKRVGPFFRGGTNASLSFIRQGDSASVALTDAGYHRLGLDN